MAQIYRALFAVVLLFTCSVARAEIVDWLYSVEVPVLSQAADDRTAAAGVALRQAISRISGLANLPNSQRLKLAVAQPDRYFSQFSYARDASGDGLLVRFEFDADAIVELCKALELPVWWANRPRLLLWALDPQGQVMAQPTVDPPGANLDANPEQSEPSMAERFTQGLTERARERGIPLTLPTADEDGNVDAPVRGIMRGEYESLAGYAERYQAEVMSAGTFRTNAAGFSGRWNVWLEGEQLPLNVRGADAQSLGAALADRLANALATRYAVTGQAGQLRLSVSGVVTPRQYAQMLRYLGSLEFVDTAVIASIKDGVLYLDLQTQASPDKLLELFAVDGYLGPAPFTPTLQERRSGFAGQTTEVVQTTAPNLGTALATSPVLATAWLGDGG